MNTETTAYAELGFDEAFNEVVTAFTTADSIDIAEIVEDLKGVYEVANHRRGKVETVTAARLAATVRAHEAAGNLVEMKVRANGRWTIAVTNGNGSGYGFYVSA